MRLTSSTDVSGDALSLCSATGQAIIYFITNTSITSGIASAHTSFKLPTVTASTSRNRITKWSSSRR